MNETPGQYPLVSVAMATYNGEAHIEQQLASILAQDYPNLEIIICDDHSRDGTISILKKFANIPNLILHLNNKNLGYIRNFEKAIALCSGEFIVLCDQDDIWVGNKISRLVSLALEREAYLVYSDAEVIDAKGDILEPSLRDAYNINYVGDNYKAFYFFNCVTGCTSLIRRELLDYCMPFPEGIIVHDWWLAFVAARFGKIAFTKEKLTRYRIHDNNEIGINAISFKKVFKEFVLSVISPKIKKTCFERQKAWEAKYFDFFSACALFENQHRLDAKFSTKLKEIIGGKDTHGFMARMKFYFANREMFHIVPKSLMPLVILSKIWPRKYSRQLQY